MEQSTVKNQIKQAYRWEGLANFIEWLRYSRTMKMEISEK